MNTTTEAKSTKRISMWNKFGQWVYVDEAHADLPHADYRYWDGGAVIGGYRPILPGMTPESACGDRQIQDQFRVVDMEHLSRTRPSAEEIREAVRIARSLHGE